MMPIKAFPGIIEPILGAKTDEILAYCAIGPRAGMAKAALALWGYQHVRHWDSHMHGRRIAGLPLKKSSPR